MEAKNLGDPIREGDWLHTGDLLVCTDDDPRRKTASSRLVRIERIAYQDDLTRSFVLAPTDCWNSKLYRTYTSEETLRRKYRRVNTNEKRVTL